MHNPRALKLPVGFADSSFTRIVGSLAELKPAAFPRLRVLSKGVNPSPKVIASS